MYFPKQKATLLLTISLSLIASYGVAEINCQEIINEQDRLACYDKAAVETENSNNSEAKNVTVLEDRRRSEKSIFENGFGILPHKRSYLMPLTYVTDIEDELVRDFDDGEEEEKLDSVELKFQYSFKVPIGRRFILGEDQLYFGFTQVSLWQAYNSDISSPFRENNYQPELLWDIPLSEPLFDGRLSHIVFGLNHQSNGLGGSLSRSWNRITFETAWADTQWVTSLRLWHRLKESREDDDNPDIVDYLGYGQLQIGYKWGDKRFTGIFYNNLDKDDNHTSVDISFSKPISRNLRGFIQYFDGYGETLINYNRRTRRIGIGVVLSDWF